MAERKDPSTGSLNTAGEREYRAERRPATSSSGGGRSDASSRGGMGVNITLAVLLVGLLAAGWFILNQKQLLDHQNTMLVEADARIKVLEDRLRMTDETLSETGDQTNEKMSFWESETRKIWALVKDKLERQLNQTMANVGTLQKTDAAIEARLREQGVQVDKLEQGLGRIQQLTDQLASMELQFQQVVDSQRDLVEKFNTQQKGLGTMRDDLNRRMRENEEAITAIDAFRAQISNRLNTLERQLTSPPLN